MIGGGIAGEGTEKAGIKLGKRRGINGRIIQKAFAPSLRISDVFTQNTKSHNMRFGEIIIT